MRSPEHLQRLDQWRAALKAESDTRRSAAARLGRYHRRWVIWYGAWTRAFHAMPAHVDDPAGHQLSHRDIAQLGAAIERAELVLRTHHHRPRGDAVTPPIPHPRGHQPPAPPRTPNGLFAAGPSH
jgi:hypothetical protein